jgi:hypothetical protein
MKKFSKYVEQIKEKLNEGSLEEYVIMGRRDGLPVWLNKRGRFTFDFSAAVVKDDAGDARALAATYGGQVISKREGQNINFRAQMTHGGAG